jgi:hypothetical protein
LICCAAATLVCLGALMGFCQSAPPADAPSVWKSYRSPDYGFEIKYPQDFAFRSGALDDLETASRSYIPVCAGSTVGCFAYAGHEYDGTNFGAAAVSVNVLRAKRNDQACAEIDTAEGPAKARTINGTLFHFAAIGDAGMGHFRGGTAYRALHQGVCFELTATIAQTNFENYDPGTIQRFYAATLEKQLDSIVHAFRFAGPVADGAAWQAYHNSDVGGTFEYPDGDSVVVAVEYSNQRGSSHEITDSRYFADHGLRYTISAKVNLRDKAALNAWLASSGFPDLGQARELARSELFTEYEAGNYYYIYGQSILYILSVTDPQGHVIAPPQNQVFLHLLKTFRPE